METAENKRFVYEFGKFALDPREKTLSKDGMMQAIWQDAFVEETNLAKQISRLRKIFNANGEKLIETLPKHGYRFLAEVRRVIQVSEEPVVIEKGTLKRLTVRVEDEFEENPPLALPPKRKTFWRGRFSRACFDCRYWRGLGSVLAEAKITCQTR